MPKQIGVQAETVDRISSRSRSIHFPWAKSIGRIRIDNIERRAGHETDKSRGSKDSHEKLPQSCFEDKPIASARRAPVFSLNLGISVIAESRLWASVRRVHLRGFQPSYICHRLIFIMTGSQDGPC